MPEKYQTPQFQETDRSRLARQAPMDNPDLKHFLHLAGGVDCLSLDETDEKWAARMMALTAMAHVRRLDESALRGLCHFIGLVKMAPETARRMLQD